MLESGVEMVLKLAGQGDNEGMGRRKPNTRTAHICNAASDHSVASSILLGPHSDLNWAKTTAGEYHSLSFASPA